jgi:hypothetical protein
MWRAIYWRDALRTAKARKEVQHYADDLKKN